MRTSTRHLLIYVMVLATAITACTQQEPLAPATITSTPEAPPTDVVVTRLAALIRGQLVYEDGCLWVRQGQARTLLVWPLEYATVVENDTVRVITGQLGGEQEVVTLQIGSQVRMGGGSVPVEHIEPELQQQVPPQCAEPFVWAVGTINSATPSPLP